MLRRKAREEAVWLTDEDVQHEDDGEEKEHHHHDMEPDVVVAEPIADRVIHAAL